MSHGFVLSLRSTMSDNGDHRSARVKHQWLTVLVFLGFLPLPLVAYALGMYVVTRGMAEGSTRQLFDSQLLLVFAALLVAGAGGFLIWRTATSLGTAADVQVGLEDFEGDLTDRLDSATSLNSGTPVMRNSVTRMLATIERQAGDLDEMTRRLHGANQEVESVRARLREVSLTDPVTGLYNRRFFTVRLEEEVARYRRFGHPLSLVLVGLDGIEVSAGSGSHDGEDMIRRIAEILLRISRNVDVICRYNSRTYALVLMETAESDVWPYTKRVGDALEDFSASRARPVTASFGVASMPGDAVSADDLVRMAEEALEVSRLTGKARRTAWTAWKVEPEPEARRA